MANIKEQMLWKAEHLQRRGDWISEKAKNHPNKDLLIKRAEKFYKEAEKYRKAAKEIEEGSEGK